MLVFSFFTMATAPLPVPLQNELDSVTRLFYALPLIAIAGIVFFHYLEKIIFRYFANKKKLEQQNDLSATLETEKIEKPIVKKVAPYIDYSKWSMDLLKSLEQDKLIKLCAVLFNMRYKVKPKLLDSKIDCGFNVSLYSANSSLIAYLRCENKELIDINLIREFSGVMGLEGLKKGYFVAVGSFSEVAVSFVKQATNKNYQQIFLISGDQLLKMILSLSKPNQKKLLDFIVKK